MIYMRYDSVRLKWLDVVGVPMVQFLHVLTVLVHRYRPPSMKWVINTWRYIWTVDRMRPAGWGPSFGNEKQACQEIFANIITRDPSLDPSFKSAP